MTELSYATIRRIVLSGDADAVPWQDEPWLSASPILEWFGFSIPAVSSNSNHKLTEENLLPWSSLMLERMTNEAGEFAWSSYMLSTALDAISAADGGVPEAFIKALWQNLQHRELSNNVYQYCRDQGRHLLSDYRGHPAWNLAWMLDAASPSQLCLTYWCMAVKPTLCTQDVIDSMYEALSVYPFQF